MSGNMPGNQPTHLLAIETAGNQAYVYRSLRLREAIGASALIARTGTDWVRDAVSSAGAAVTEVVATSGKSVLIGTETALRSVLQRVTLTALVEAPGLEVTGGIAPIESDGFFPALAAAFARLADNRSRLRGPENRMRRLPVVDSCESTGLPAAAVLKVHRDHRVLGHEALAKRSAADAGWRSMAGAVEGITFVRSIDQLDDAMPGAWSAIVHADGSGMGQLFLAFDQHLRASGRAELLDNVEGAAAAYRTLSTAIEWCTNEAWKDAARAVARNDGRALLVPVLLGGDDITVIAEGSVALAFASEYLRAFARITGENNDLKGLGVTGLSAGASVVWTKPGFPYSSAYDLAEQRLRSAKRVAKQQATAGRVPSVIDVLVLYDTLIDADDRTAPDNPAVRLTANPYTIDEVPGLTPLGQLTSLVDAVRSKQLASTQLHELRSLATTVGVGPAQRRLDELRTTHRELHQQLHPLAGTRGVMLLDALDVADASARPSSTEEAA